MTIERTLSIIKPDAVAQELIGEIYSRFKKAGLKVVAARMLHLSQQQAESFYSMHKDRPFFKDLVNFMTQGAVMVQVLEADDAVARHRTLMGATDPKMAAKGTIRGDLATSIEANLVHGSDMIESARTEVAFFFKDNEIFS